MSPRMTARRRLDIALRAMIRQELPDATIIFAATDENAEDADLVIKIDASGSARSESANPSPKQDHNADKTRGRETP